MSGFDCNTGVKRPQGLQWLNPSPRGATDDAPGVGLAQDSRSGV